jgi:hypothetical protein
MCRDEDGACLALWARNYDTFLRRRKRERRQSNLFSMPRNALCTIIVVDYRNQHDLSLSSHDRNMSSRTNKSIIERIEGDDRVKEIGLSRRCRSLEKGSEESFVRSGIGMTIRIARLRSVCRRARGNRQISHWSI